MAFEWSEEQKKVIELRDRSLLVSAAAGSGKTAVLVERILTMITDPERPLDIDRLLVVTFTKAAAAEMRERLRAALEKRILSEEETGRANGRMTDHLKKQILLLRDAKICTIDAFCTYIVRNHFYALDIAPGFRIGDNGELELIKNDVLSEILENAYEEADEQFIRFTESFSSGKDDRKAEDLILSLFRLSESAPWPDEWLDHCLDGYDIPENGGIDGTNWGKYLTEAVRFSIRKCADDAEAYIGKLQAEGEYGSYLIPTFEADAAMLREISDALDFGTLRDRIGSAKFAAIKQLPKALKEDEDAVRINTEAKELRKQIKAAFAKEADRTVSSEAVTIAALREAKPCLSELVRLTKLFSENYRAEKKRRGLADFSDLEHFTLSIFLDEKKERTEVARMYAERFEEILIDEYQDSNLVQDTMFHAISRETEGKPNIFMVGDVKQSIYSFRMADPTLFLEKYETYSPETSEHQKIELFRNFRSRALLLQNINFFFDAIMQRSVGGIDYTEENALHGGFVPEHEDPTFRPVPAEILLAETGGDEEDGDETDPTAEVGRLELESGLIANKIRELTADGSDARIYDTETGQYRKIRCADIVILLRAKKGWTETFSETLTRQGIPAYTDAGGGYFDAGEVALILDILRVIDNPMQDIPLVSVLHSPVFGFSADRLSKIRLNFLKAEDTEGAGFYAALRADQSPETAAFFRRLSEWRDKALRQDLSAFLRYLYADTGLYTYYSAVADGDRKKANLDVLIDMAASFEQTSFRGIFRFIRYIERLKEKTEAEEQEASTVHEGAVRIMSIHNSKGMEFPVVFLAGIDKKFNMTDLNSKVLMHGTFGIGADLIDAERRTRTKTLNREAIREKMLTELLGEELRVLYVAMTRARERLYLVGAVKDYDKTRAKYEGVWDSEPKKLSYIKLHGARSYEDWLLEAYRYTSGMPLYVIPKREIEWSDGAEEADSSERDFNPADGDLRTITETVREKVRELDERLTYDYLYDGLYKAYPTVSVSALKARYHEETAAEAEAVPESLVNDIPAAPEGAITGAERGTLYHLVMEKLDPECDISVSLSMMAKEGLISEREKDIINVNKIGQFFASDIGKRFKKAYAEGQGFREKPFIIGRPIREVYPELAVIRAEDERIMIQGIIDMYFEERDGLVVVDYKTDRVAAESVLTERYRIQLDLYAEALETITGKKVKEKWIWSFALDRAILL